MDELTENLQKLNLLRAQFDQNKDLQTPPKKSQVGPGEWHFANFFVFVFFFLETKNLMSFRIFSCSTETKEGECKTNIEVLQ